MMPQPRAGPGLTGVFRELSGDPDRSGFLNPIQVHPEITRAFYQES